MNITEICIRRPVLAWMIMAATIVFGLIATRRIGISQFPDVDFPTISVTLNWEGAAPDVIEHDVVETVEESLAQVEGIKAMSSTCRQGTATITVELDLSRDVDAALQDVQTRIAQARQRLPADLDPPIVSKTNPEDNPILWVSVSGTYPPAFLADFARFRLRERFQRVVGVGEVMMGGYQERNLRIWMDADALASRDLSVAEVVRAISREHVELPAGRLAAGTREVEVRVLGEAWDLEAFRQMPIAQRPGGIVRLSDVALVEDGFEDVRRMSRFNGLPAQGVGVKKQRGANAVAVAAGVRAAMEELRAELPPGMSLDVNFDSTRFVEESVKEVQFELLLSVLLTAVVCWIFLGSISSTMNVVLAIPMSLFGTVAVLYFAGFTLNTFTLLGLALAVGIVVDDAIMVLESIVRHREEGLDPVEAARVGTSRIVFAAFASSLSVAAIFTPVLFMEGVVGKYFLQFGVTLIVAVALSYLEAITLAPARCAQMLRIGGERGWLGRRVEAGWHTMERSYARVLDVVLRRRWIGWGSAAVLLGATVQIARILPKEMVPSQDQSRLMVRMQTAVGSSILESDALVREAEAALQGRPEIERMFAVVGAAFGGGVNAGMMVLTLVDPDERDMTQTEFMGFLRGRLNAIPGVKAMVQDLSQQTFSARRGYPIEFVLQGQEWGALLLTTDDLMAKLKATGLVVDLDSDYELGTPELRIVPDRARSADLGVSAADVATTVQALVGGVRIGKFDAGGRRIDVRLRLLEGQRQSPEDIGRLKVRGADGTLLPLSTLVHSEEAPALQSIARRDRARAVTVYGNPAPGHSQQEAMAKVTELAKDLPPGTRVTFGGASVAFQESGQSLLFALGLGILVAYMVLASQFNSLRHPLTVLAVLPLAVGGALLALWLTGKSLNVFSMIGVLLLLGLVTKNSILLVDHAIAARARGLGAVEAMREAGPRRLRPIVMTAVATMAAAVPTALGLGPGSEIRTPMALAILGGLIVSTVLSLIVVPVVYVGRAKSA